MKIYIAFFILIVFSIFIFQAVPSLASSQFDNGLNKTGSASGAGTVYESSNVADPASFLAKMVGTILAPIMMGVFAMLILGYAGYTLMSARGDEQKVEKAKTMIVNTIMALIVVFSAYAIFTLIIPLWKFVTE